MGLPAGGDGAAHPPAGQAGEGREPVVVLLARPARERSPSAVVWQVLAYDRDTRVPVEEVASRWEPASLAAGLRPGQDITVPSRIVHWLQLVLGGTVTVTGPAHDYAGPASWHLQPDPTGAGSAGAASAAGTGVRG